MMATVLEGLAKNLWWRWPVLPFAAVVGGCAAALLMTAFQWFSMKFTGYSSEGWYYSYIVPIFVTATFGWAFSYISWHVAPQGKIIAGVVMVTLLAVLLALGLVVLWLSDKFPLERMISDTVEAVVTIAAAIVGLMQQHAEAPKPHPLKALL